jgi:hypothetical protein
MTAQESPDTTAHPSSPAPRHGGKVRRWPLVAAGLGLLLVWNAFAPAEQTESPGRSPAAGASAVGASTPAPSVSPTDTGPSLPRSAPRRLTIPAIAADAPFVPLSLNGKGQLEAPPPDDRNLVGWYRDAATPGERGTAIVAGHVDTRTGPAVFVYLRVLKPGSTVEITRADGNVAVFRVDSVESFSKSDFPDERVYADARSPQLRLITCGGTYDRSVRDYTENVVVFAHLDTVRRA